ncbi:hypothetical protein HQ346_15475 [Rhodococcus sp. BP-252]|uniref:hypothetical protein n=1 Tax=unclassified Rhodococcus (in: high G+C Gram-positive bacteria) TaxID=192944 RepID=UPI001C9B343B|nr:MULTISPECIES: hypothetical protein [unclassified Rhodococcus (in: high G+C Gram-positive bacteria)]MBY6413137.1 hypothetical protein [Rhodococcus sp. BP-320]MBY6417700.1 hypothetical protein [Rhodococcus sp. BP-321]MBY6423276.1 hypothetical protein [Rhodococcus sp. BP-324]MBY6427879.1 hypothetical protein [Rhodococcus sp. BP-323]MBY6431878.1 hypothetical protein [Rhodococcus sp. BP-322]
MTTDRLSVVDEIFLRTHRGYGLPIVLQGILRTDEVVARVDLAAIHANLALGSLGRRVVTPSIPGARRRWVPSSETLPLVVDDGRIPDSDVLDWADAQGDVDLDPENGPGWRLSATTTRGGGTVVSLVCSHALADAAGLIAAAACAFEGSAPQRFSRRTSDLADAVKLGTTVTAGSVKALAGLVRDPESRRELNGYIGGSDRTASHDVAIATAVFDVAATPNNAEFVAIVSDIAVELGLDAPVSVNMPFRVPTQGANRIGMVTIDVTPGDTVDEIKTAYTAAFANPAGAPGGFPAETVQLLPDRLAATLTSKPGRARVLCSNIGRLPDSIMEIGPHRVRSIATRALHPGADRSITATSLSAYLAYTDRQCTLSLVGTDATLASSSDDVRRGAEAVLARRRLDARSWR